MRFFKSLNKSNGIFALIVVVMIVAAVAYSGSIRGLPDFSWAEGTASGTSAGASVNPLPAIGPDTIPDIVTKVSPAVVRIDTTEQINTSADPFFNDPYFRYFFGQNFAPSQPRVANGLGSGFIVSSDGYILTNEHVVSSADSIEVTLAGHDKSYPATKVGEDHDLDLAVLKIEAEIELPTIALGSSDSIRVGDWVIAIGNPYGLDHTVTVGVISAKGRPISLEDRNYKNLLQTDASINPGNSGGPLLNLNGEVIGINTAINAEATGIGFAIPSSTVDAVFDDLVNKGGVDHPWLGVSLQPVTEEIARYYNLPNVNAAMISQVTEGGPAAKAGLQRGDAVTGYNGNSVANPNELVDLVGETAIGSQVEITFIRGGQSMSLNVTIEAR